MQSAVETTELQSASAGTAAGAMRRPTLGDLLQLIRPGQWVKSIIVVPLALLGAPVPAVSALLRLGWAILAFILASALCYTINDIADRNLDRVHPTKRMRPVASGRVSVPAASALAVVLGSLLVLVAVSHPPLAGWWPIAVYLALNVLYSSWLKHKPLLELFAVAMGFVLRVVQGSLSAGRQPPEWLLLCVLSLCLLLSLGKRRHELATAGESHRPVLANYSSQFLDYLILVTSVVGIVAFLLHLRFETVAWASWPPLFISGLCAFAAIFRYLQVLLVNQGGGNPVRTLMRDPFILTAGAAWVGVCLYATFVPHLIGQG